MVPFQRTVQHPGYSLSRARMSFLNSLGFKHLQTSRSTRRWQAFPRPPERPGALAPYAISAWKHALTVNTATSRGPLPQRPALGRRPRAHTALDASCSRTGTCARMSTARAEVLNAGEACAWPCQGGSNHGPAQTTSVPGMPRASGGGIPGLQPRAASSRVQTPGLAPCVSLRHRLRPIRPGQLGVRGVLHVNPGEQVPCVRNGGHSRRARAPARRGASR